MEGVLRVETKKPEGDKKKLKKIESVRVNQLN
jgi:hypothetical protein